MSLSQPNSNHSYKQLSRKEHPRKVSPFPASLHQTSQNKDFKLFQRGKLLEPKSCTEIELSGEQKCRKNQKIFTTDESNNQKVVNMHESIYVQQKLPKNQQFQQPLNFKPKKFKVVGSKRQIKNSKMQNLNFKLNKMNQLMRSQDHQLKQMKSSMSQRELHRLIKIHSIEKLKLLQSIKVVKNSSKKNIKK